MSKTKKSDINDLLSLFEDALSPADVLSSKLMAQVSTIITRERVKLRMTQSEFADYINVTQSQISRWEHGDYNFSLEKIADIAAKLGLDININFTSTSLYKSVEEFSCEQIFPQTQVIKFKQTDDLFSTNRVYLPKPYTKSIRSIKEEYYHA